MRPDSGGSNHPDDGSWVNALGWRDAGQQHDVGKWSQDLACGRRVKIDFSLLRNLQRVIDLNAKISDGASGLGIAK